MLRHRILLSVGVDSDVHYGILRCTHYRFVTVHELKTKSHIDEPGGHELRALPDARIDPSGQNPPARLSVRISRKR